MLRSIVLIFDLDGGVTRMRKAQKDRLHVRRTIGYENGFWSPCSIRREHGLARPDKLSAYQGTPPGTRVESLELGAGAAAVWEYFSGGSSAAG
jgi:hypothetical protein